jgi:hypothetical protein
MKRISLPSQPQPEALISILKNTVSGKLSYYVNYKNNQVEIIIKKSPFMAAFISTKNNQIIIEGMFPSHFISSIASFFSITYLNLHTYLKNPWHKLETELANVIEHNYKP